MPLFAYDPLPNPRSIRLLRLDPSPRLNEPLCGTFVTTEIDDVPAFEAISYVWGEASFSETICMTHERGISITPNLAAAFRGLRGHNETRLLWADGVCIDQSSKAEKMVQVPLMAHVYQKATRVLAWLGEDDRDLQQAFECIRGTPEPAEPKNAGTTSLEENESREAIGEAQAHQVELLFQNQWFTRLWVAQEAILAQDLQLYCGNQSIAWADLHSFIHQRPALPMGLTSNALAGHRYAQNLGHARSDWQNQQRARRLFGKLLGDGWRSSNSDTFAKTFVTRGIEAHREAMEMSGPWEPPRLDFDRGNIFMDIFWSLQSRYCRDDRDRVYGALGFLAWDVPLKILPDYSKSVCDVYVEFAAAMLNLHYVEILLYAGLWDRVTDENANNEDGNCPSWVPELRPSRLKTGTTIAWDHPMLNEPIKTLETPRIHWPSPDEGPCGNAAATFRLGQRRLEIEGTIFDRIAKIRQWTGGLESVEEVIYALRLYFLGYVDLKGKEMKFDDFGKLLGILAYPELGTEGRDDPDADMARLGTLLLEDEKEVISWLAESQRLLLENMLPAEDEQWFRDIVNLAQFLCKKLTGRLFFTTETGECGLAPARAEPGDCLVRFLGLGVECLIRSVEHSSDFRLIGPCYYHGSPTIDAFAQGFQVISLI